jgi:hypothetical protein
VQSNKFLEWPTKCLYWTKICEADPFIEIWSSSITYTSEPRLLHMVVEPNFDSHVMVNSVGVVSWGTENQLCSFTRHQFRAKVWIAEELTYHIIEFYSMIQQLEDTNWDHALKNTGSAVAQCDTLVSRIWNVVPGGGSHSSSIPPPCSTWATHTPLHSASFPSRFGLFSCLMDRSLQLSPDFGSLVNRWWPDESRRVVIAYVPCNILSIQHSPWLSMSS